MSTLTSTQVAAAVAGTLILPSDPLRVNAQFVKITAANLGAATVSTGDVIQAIAVPAWSRILDVGVSRATSPTDSMVFTTDFGGTAGLLGSDSFSTTTGVSINRNSLNSGYLLSISEAAAVQFDTIDITLSSLSASATCDLHVHVIYTYEPYRRT